MPQAKGLLHHIQRRLQTQEDYFGFRNKMANLSSGVNSIQSGESDVEDDQIRFQFFASPDRF